MPEEPLVAIVGRPNVGKSTLFNRIIQRRQAVVDELPGVTRDRVYARTEWAGTGFRLVDTGGLVPGSKDPMETAIRAQAAVAIDEAAVILFVADVETGVTDLDSAVATRLRRSDRPVLLAVNKVDNATRELETHVFNALGLGEPYPVSAISGRGSGDLLEALVTLIGDSEAGSREAIGETGSGEDRGEDEQEPAAPLKVAVLGRPNVGKSSFVNRVCGAERVIVTPEPGTTRDPSDINVSLGEERLVLIDTAGLRRRTRVKESVEYYSALRALQSLDRCDVALVLVDAVEGFAAQDARILERVLDRGKGAVLVVNKWDLIEKETGTAEAYEREVRKALPFASFLELVFTSALTGQRVERALELAVQAGESRRSRIATAVFNRFVERTFRGNEAITPAMGDLRVSYATQAGIEPPLFIFFVNDPKRVKPNFKRYLERCIREEFILTGTPLRLVFRSKA